MNLRSVGTIRDAQKWPKRDARKDPDRLDCINYNLLSPFTIQKMIKGTKLLHNLQYSSGELSDEYAYHSTKIKNSSLKKGLELYRTAIIKFLGNSLIKRLEHLPAGASDKEIQDAMKPDTTIGTGHWVDLSGMIAPKSVIEDVMSRIESGGIDSIDEINSTFAEIHRNYYTYEWTWAYGEYKDFFGIDPATITAADVISIVEQWKEAVIGLDKIIYEDARKEFSLASMTGFGADGTKEDKEMDFEQVRGDKRQYAYSFAIQHQNTDPFQARRLYEAYDGKLFVVQNPPAKPLTTQEMDDIYALPYMRAYHPSYEKDGGIPALSEIKFSLTSNRGCFGDCNFCALTFHEGRIVQCRSHRSIIEEANACLSDPDFKGYIHDVGGPTAEFRRPACDKQLTKGACKDRRCLYPKPCPNLKVDHSDYLSLLRKLRALPGVKKVFVRSGFRFDYLLADQDRTFLRELCQYHVSGQLRVAPEHISDAVLAKMGKPSVEVYNAFCREFEKMNEKLGKDQYIVPYLMSSHPGSTMKDAIALAEYIRDLGYMPEQVQDFYPTRARGVHSRPGLHAGAGAGLLPHAGHGLDLHVLHRS